MSNRCARILAAGGTAVLVAALGVPAALAAATAKTWTVQPGGAITATSSGQFTLIDTTTGTVDRCPSATASGTLKHGSGLPGSRVGSLSAVGFTTCTNPGIRDSDIKLPLQATDLPWHVNLSSYNTATGVVTGTVSHIQIMSPGNGCEFVIDGTSGTASDGRVRFQYADSTGRLTVLTTGSNLHIYDVSQGCLGVFKDGDPITLSTTYAVSPEQAITRP